MRDAGYLLLSIQSEVQRGLFDQPITVSKEKILTNQSEGTPDLLKRKKMQGICFSQSQARYSVAYEPREDPGGRNFKEREDERKKGTLFRYL